MQAARLLEPRPRTLRSKLIEMARAVQLEARYGRHGVLDIWLTLAPFGGNLEGVRAGSLAWFGVPPDALEPAQAALLVAIPRRPERCARTATPPRRPRCATASWRSGSAPDCSMPRRRRCPLPASPLPRHAPQLAASLPRTPRVRTTLDLPLQAALERLGQERLETLPQRASLALLVADAQAREIRALYPGAWRDQARAGAIDLTLAVRSPGSALKPFIYAMAFADGIAAPDTVVPDLPRRFGGYAPENFDRGFAGSVTAAEALRRSLNLPAVALLDRVGPLRFAATLRFAGCDAPPAAWRRSVAAARARRRRHHPARRGRALCRARDRRHRRPAAPARRPSRRHDRFPRRQRGARRSPMCSPVRCRTSARAASPGRPARAGAAATPGRSASTPAMSLRCGSGGRTARRCRAPPAPRSPCRCCRACSICCRRRPAT